MIQQTTKLIGTEITTSTSFKNISGVKFAPNTVQLKYKSPNNTLVSLVIMPDAKMVYASTILLDIVGTWKFRWESLGSYASADEFEVFVEESILRG
jgi:hypothetical protein